MRIEANIGPVTLVLERDKHPKAGERFKVAVFVADRAMGVAIISYEAWVAFCQASPTMRTMPGPSTPGPFKDYQRCDVTVIGTASATAVVSIDVPLDFFVEDDVERGNLTKEQIADYARMYVDNLASDNGLTIDWDLDPVDFVDVSDVSVKEKS